MNVPELRRDYMKFDRAQLISAIQWLKAETPRIKPILQRGYGVEELLADMRSRLKGLSERQPEEREPVDLGIPPVSQLDPEQAPPQPVVVGERAPDAKQALLATTLSSLPGLLPARAQAIGKLRKAGINTIGDLDVDMDLTNIKGVGEKSMAAIFAAVRAFYEANGE